MVSRIERYPERVPEKHKPFVIDLKTPKKFKHEEFDKFVQENKDPWKSNDRIVLCWIATGAKLFVFPKGVGHARAYRIVERMNGQAIQSAGYLALACRWGDISHRYIYDGAESLTLVLPPKHTGYVKNKINNSRLKDHFIPYPPPGTR